MIRLVVGGATGRMGRRVLALAGADARFDVVAAITREDDPALDRPIVWETGSIQPRAEWDADAEADVIVDFSMPTGTSRFLEACPQRGCAMVIGTTGHDDAQQAAIRASAERIPVAWASNFSVGVTVMRSILGRVASALGEAFDVEIVETHHRHKADAPSGTALMLLDAVLEATGGSRDSAAVFGRSGTGQTRPVGQIGVHAVRMGEIVGQHTVYFSGPGETIALTHTAHSRDTFAAGALRAAEWVVSQPPGLYDMRDVLGL